MEKRKTNLMENGLIWFGAAVSLAEILTGASLAPIGLKKGIIAILIGHIIGCALLFLAGVIGGKTQKSSMETARRSFGLKGANLFVILNVIQLVGWTAIMIFDGAIAANALFDLGSSFWAVIIGVLIILWIIAGVTRLKIINTVAMSSLLILTAVLSVTVFKNNGVEFVTSEILSFGSAVELSIAMPLSWLPLISDYTKDAEKPVKASLVSSVVYGLASCWMYIIGMGASIFAASSDIASIMLKAGLGVAGLIIVVFSTVTTTFMDAYSAGVSAEALSSKISGKWLSVGVTVISILGAVFLPLYDITGFLYFIGSVFAPMVAIQIADYFILKNNFEESVFNVKNLIIWLVGFVVYRILMNFDFIVGYTTVDIIVTILICIIFANRKVK